MKKIIAVDFDGTLVKELDKAYLATEFELMPNAKEVINWMCDNFYIILWTCRNEKCLQNAVDFLNKNAIVFHAINENADFLDFETSSKIYADVYIDNRAMCEINWLKIKDYLSTLLLNDDDKIISQVVIEVNK
jgi:hydroxymethylpyrimidine pyrophosphatase-like HAD family hydrolase